MLTEETAMALGYKGNFKNFKIQTVSFANTKQIWNKTKEVMSNCLNINNEKNLPMSNKHHFIKYGKTFGFQTARFVQYWKGKFYYFQNKDDKQYKGYCPIENLYVYYLDVGDKGMMYLTNAYGFACLYFKDGTFLNQIKEEFVKQIIQLNFKQKYTMHHILGEGTFSKVFLGICNRTGEKYAIKVVPKQSKTYYSTKNIVLQEKRILRDLNSKQICKMKQFFEDSHNFIIVLEYLKGEDLSNIFKSNKQLTLNECKFIFKQTLLGLDFMHKRNIIHRDLKPHNIIFNIEDQSVKLIDFGLSLCYDNNTDISKFIRCGTMGYIAPEVLTNCENSRKRYDTKSDMFGFGIIAHMLLMGSNPLRGKTYKETVDKNMKCEVILNQKMITSKYGMKCYEFLLSLLQKDPIKRPSAEELLKCDFLNQDEQICELNIVDENFVFKNEEINYLQDKQFIGGNSNILGEGRDLRQSRSMAKRDSLVSSKSSTRFSGII